ncbi:MAG TPA: DUF4142 domain-containing protein [Burkholderiaceae bacterium]
MKNRTTALIATAVLSLAAGGAWAQAASAPVKLTHQDSSFLKDAAEAGNAEVEGSRLAESRTQNADVKSFAQMMVDDHTKAGDELKNLAQEKGVKVSDKPSLTKQAEIKLLSKAKDASFDKHYVNTIGVKAHEDTIKLFQKEIAKGKDADIKAWASKTLPTLQHHLEAANTLKAKTDAEKK